MLHHYHAEHEQPASPDAVVPLLIQRFQPKSVIDVGCGLGQWLEAFLRHQPSVCVLGIDGCHVPKDRLRIPVEHFMTVDLASHEIAKVDLGRRFDLAMSLEVAEHLREEHAESYVGFLTSLSDIILFSAAIPGQTGENHYNEQWPGYWAERFGRLGYVMLDDIRWEIWDQRQVSWWYRQNMFLVVHKSRVGGTNSSPVLRSVVHPDCFAHLQSQLSASEERVSRVETRLNNYMSGNIGGRSLLALIKKFIARRLRLSRA